MEPKFVITLQNAYKVDTIFFPRLSLATDYSETGVTSVVIGAVTHVTINSVNPVAAIVTFITQRINTAATTVSKVPLLQFFRFIRIS